MLPQTRLISSATIDASNIFKLGKIESSRIILYKTNTTLASHNNLCNYKASGLTGSFTGQLNTKDYGTYKTIL